MKVEELLGKINEQIDSKLEAISAKINEVDTKIKDIPDTPEKDQGQKVEWKEICDRVALITRAQVNRDPRAFAALQKADWFNVDTDSEGGYLVPTEFSDRIFRLADDYGVARRDAFTVNMKSNTKKMPAGLTGVTMTYVDEGGKKPLTKGSFGTVELVARTASGISAMTNDIVQDSSPDLVSYLERLIPESLAKREDTSIFFGNDGTIEGITGATADNAIEAVATQTASGATVDGVTLDDLNEMKYGIKGSAAVGAKFYCNRNFIGVLERIKDDNGRYLISTSPDNGAVKKIWGVPIETSDAFPSSPTAGDIVAVFGNLQNCYHGQRAGLAILPSDTATLGDYDEEGNLTDIISAYGQNMRFIRFEVRHDFKPAIGSAFVALQLASS